MAGTCEIRFDSDGIDWHRLADIYERAPLARRAPCDLERAFRNSYLACFAFRDGELVGAARVNSEGVYYATIVDVAVAPEHQRQGVGRAMMGALLARLPMEKIYLTAIPGKERFYRRFGFLRQTNAMGLYIGRSRDQAIANGVLTE